MKTFIRIGIDLAKNFFQVHAIEREGEPAVTRKLSRGKVLAFFAQAAPCRVGMEACGSSHYWAREIRALGHEVVLIPPAYIDVHQVVVSTQTIHASARTLNILARTPCAGPARVLSVT